MGDAKNKLKQFKEAYLYWGYALAYTDDKELKEKTFGTEKTTQPLSFSILPQHNFFLFSNISSPR